MNNTAPAIDKEVAATEEHIFSDEMIAKILEAEAYMETHPDEWITAEESIKRLQEIVDTHV